MATTPAPTAASDEFRIIGAPRIEFAHERFEYMLLQLNDPALGQRYRVITFKELTRLPIEERDDPDMVGKQWAAIRGLYNAGVDFVYTVMGAFKPEHLGVAQFYGAAAEASTERRAIDQALMRMAAVEATLANYPQSRLTRPGPDRIGMLMSRLQRLPHIIALLGHPDPRLARKGMGRDGSLGEADDEMLSQQGENMLRGLAKLRTDFVYTVTAHHVGRKSLSQALVKMSRWSSQYASRQRGALGASFSIAIPLAAALGGTTSASHGSGQTHAVSHSDGVSHGHSASESQSWGHGFSHGEAHSSADSVSHSTTDGVAHSLGHNVGHSSADSSSWGHTDSTAHTTSHGTSVAHSSGTSHSESSGSGSSWSAGQSQGQSQSQSLGSKWGSSSGVTASSSQSQGTSQGVTSSASSTNSTGSGITSSNSAGASSGNNWSAGGSVSAGLLGTGVTGNASVGGNSATSQTHSMGGSTTFGSSDTTGTAINSGTSAQQGSGLSLSHGSSVGGSASAGQSVSSGTSSSAGGSSSHTVSNGSFNSTTRGESWGTANTVGHADSRGGAHSTGQSSGSSWGVSRVHSSTSGQAHTEAQTESVGESWSEGRSAGRAESWGQSHSDGRSQALSIARAGSRGYIGGLGAGIVPGIAISRSWQSEDDVAIRLTDITRQLVSLLNTASHEGGFYTTATLAVEKEGLTAAEALIPQSFHGTNVPTPVLTVRGGDALRPFMLAFRPSLLPDGDPFGVGLWTKWSTLLTAEMLAAYTAPNVFEEGTAITVQEKIPPLGFYPLLQGDVLLGHQVSPETADLTTAPLRLSRKRHFHTAFMGDTGYGKTVAAERMAYETTINWRMKTIVLDFGAGWRKMLNAPGLAGHVEIRQLSPGGVRPLRWNPLQIGRNILPEVQWRSFCDIFGNIAQLGGKRQIHELRAMLHRLYVEHGVLTDDPEVRNNPTWSVVASAEEATLVGKPEGTPLAALTRDERQLLAVRRSQSVGLKDLYEALEKEIETVPPRDIRRSILEGISFRLDPLVHGEAALQYAAGPDAIDINEVVPGDWGIAILEGGAFLDDFSKAFLLGWVAWHIYTDAVIQRIHRSKSEPAHIQIFFEEANKILSGVGDRGGGEEGGMSLAEQFAAMWRDSRKYGIFLHLITQTPSEIPPGIMSSCNNVFAGQLKNVKDLDIAIQSIHRSPKGFTDETWRRFLASLPVARAIAKLGYSFDRGQVEPVYIQPKLLNIEEPTDPEIEAQLGAITF